MVIAPCSQIAVHPGPLLLSGAHDGPGLLAHRTRWGSLGGLDGQSAWANVRAAAIRGRGGAAFPFARKVETVVRRRGRPVVVVNAAEGEPASAKDTALLTTSPHLVLDGAEAAALIIGAKEIHVVTSQDRSHATQVLKAALDERSPRGLSWRHHVAAPRFVSGQARAVLELLEGRAGLPVTAWAPEAVSGYRSRPTLLSNAETFAHVGALCLVGPQVYHALGTDQEPGTTLLTVAGFADDDGRLPGAQVVEVEHATPLKDVLTCEALDAPLLVGGFHGRWLAPGAGRDLRISARDFAAHQVALGAGVLAPLLDDSCPVSRTADIIRYLAAESAGRCGPCVNGLPTLSREVDLFAAGMDTRPEISELAATVTGRGACAHPDGTARLVGSLLNALPEALSAHTKGACSCPRRAAPAA